MGRRADWENAKDNYPSYQHGEAPWAAFFEQHPEVMYAILGDIAKVYVATDTERRVGRRPGVNMSLDDLQKIISPRYSMDPLSVSLPELIGTRSQRAFASRVPCAHTTLRRYITGELTPDRYQLEAMARAGRVSPAYFREWREAFVADALRQVFEANPNVSVAAYKKLRAVETA